MRCRFFSLVMVSIVCMLSMTAVSAQEAARLWTSNNGHFRLSYTSDLQPLAINRMHGWVLHVEDAAGQPVTGASIEVDGGMPAHNHGLATAPEVTQELGEGDYQLEGLRFHMMGYWELRIIITKEDLSDTVIVPVEL